MILKEARATLTLALPIVGAQLAQIAIHTTDVLILARLSDHALAVGALAFALYWFFWMMGQGLSFAVSPLVAQAVGRNAADVEAVRAATHDGLIVTLVMSVACTALIWSAEPFLVWFGQPAELIPDTMVFLRLISLSLLPLIWFSVLRSFTAALSRPRPAMMFVLGCVFLNAVLVYGFTFGMAGIPGMGIVGAGIGSTLAGWLLFLGFAVYLSLDRRFAAYRIFTSSWRSSSARIGRFLRIGTPIALTLGSEVGLFSLAGQLMGRLGADAVAAHLVALQWATIAFMVPTGIAQAATVRVGLAAGARDMRGVLRAGWIAIGMGIAFMASSGLLFWLAGPQLIGLFVTDRTSPVFALAVSYLALAALFQLVDGAQAVTNGALRGLKDTTLPMLFAAFGYWACGFPIAVWFGFYTPLQGQGIWLGLVAGLAVAAILLVWRFGWWTRRLGRMQRRSPAG